MLTWYLKQDFHIIFVVRPLFCQLEPSARKCFFASNWTTTKTWCQYFLRSHSYVFYICPQGYPRPSIRCVKFNILFLQWDPSLVSNFNQVEKNVFLPNWTPWMKKAWCHCFLCSTCVPNNPFFLGKISPKSKIQNQMIFWVFQSPEAKLF